MQLPPHLKTSSVNWLAVSTSYNALIAAELEQNPEAPKPNLESILGGSDADTQPPFDRIAAYTERLDATRATSPLGHVFFNGKHLDMNDVSSFLYFFLTVEFKTNRGRFMKNLIRQLQIELNQQISFLQEKVGHHFC
jgi:UDP-glucose:glycoprotein glucosyltransferase